MNGDIEEEEEAQGRSEGTSVFSTQLAEEEERKKSGELVILLLGRIVRIRVLVKTLFRDRIIVTIRLSEGEEKKKKAALAGR